MLGDYTAVPTLPVKDMAAATAFYENTLGLTRKMEDPGGGGVFYATGDGALFVYESAFAGTNKGTAVSFNVSAGTFAAEVAALRAAGITFATFDLPGTTWDDGVATMTDAGLRAVWFTDPDGNFISVDEMPAT